MLFRLVLAMCASAQVEVQSEVEDVLSTLGEDVLSTLGRGHHLKDLIDKYIGGPAQGELDEVKRLLTWLKLQKPQGGADDENQFHERQHYLCYHACDEHGEIDPDGTPKHIDWTKLCDGKQDCCDNSDEETRMCIRMKRTNLDSTRPEELEVHCMNGELDPNNRLKCNSYRKYHYLEDVLLTRSGHSSG